MAPCLFLSLKKFRRISRLSGPVFTRNYFSKLKDKRILIIGDCDSSERKKLSTKFNLQLKDIFCYNSLPFIAPKVQFERKDILKLSAFIKRINPDIIFVCVGNPRQEILAADLLKYHKNKKFLCIGAALDFILGRKEEAPKMIRELGLEWFYRLATDFNYSKKKVWRSLLGLAYLSDIELKD
jgi:exopolysaccharide biosynthesis WecB/TagA/CpsF family protein